MLRSINRDALSYIHTCSLSLEVAYRVSKWGKAEGKFGGEGAKRDQEIVSDSQYGAADWGESMEIISVTLQAVRESEGNYEVTGRRNSSS